MTNDTRRLGEEKEGKDKDMQEVETLKEEDKEKEDMQQVVAARGCNMLKEINFWNLWLLKGNEEYRKPELI